MARSEAVHDISLRFDQTVPRQLAHRRALGEVFVADSVEAGDGVYLLAVQVPRAHSLWFDRRVAYHDPLCAVEATRQASFVVVHRHLGVPLGLPFTLRSFQFRIEDLDAYRDTRSSPLEGILQLRLADRHKGGVELGSLSLEGKLTIAGSLAMTVGGEIVFLPEADYEALRAYQRRRKPLGVGKSTVPVRPLKPALVGRFDERNVVIGVPTADAQGDVRFPLVVDDTHPSFFDHEFDHVPGPLIGEAFRQAAIVTACRGGVLRSPVATVAACEAKFSDFGELDALVEISACVRTANQQGATVDVAVYQFGKQIAQGSITLREYPAGAF